MSTNIATDYPIISSNQAKQRIHQLLLAPAKADLQQTFDDYSFNQCPPSLVITQTTPIQSSPANLLILKQMPDNSVFFYSATSIHASMAPTVFASSIAIGAGAAALPEELVWKKFWQLVGRWLAKRGIAAGTVAALDGPLPIGEIIAIGIGIYTIYELIEHWDDIWAEAERLITVLMSQRKKKQAIGLMDVLMVHIARLINEPFCGKPNDHQDGRTSGTESHWLDEIETFLNNIINLGFSERQLRRILENKFGTKKMRHIIEQLAEIAERFGRQLPDILRRAFADLLR